MGFHLSSNLLRTSIFLRNLIRNNSEYGRKTSMEKREIQENNFDHIYKRPLTESDAVTYIVENVIYKNDDFIVTSKPYGVSSAKKSKNLQYYIPQTFVNISLTDILPDVAKKLGYKRLQPAKVPERFASGVMILAITDSGFKQINNALKSARGSQKLFHSYLAITVGCPAKNDCVTKFGIQILKNNDGNYPVILDQWSRNSAKRKEVKVVYWKHSILSQSDFASLVNVNISNTHKNSLKLYLATKCFSPVLGDWIFSCRILDFFGVPLLLNSNTHSKTPQSLNSKLLSNLQIKENEMKIIPCHVHLESLTLPLKRKVDTTFTVPPSDTFAWTCQQLNLKLPF